MTDTPTANEPRPPDASTAGRTVEVLEAQRAFYLRSIDDLQAEHADGDLSDDRYRALLDSYTVEAATVLRALERARASPSAAETARGRRPRRPTWPAIGITAMLVLGGGGALLTRSLTDRQPGGTITGNAQSQTPDLAALAQAARARPDDSLAQLAYGQALLQANRLVDALETFDAAARLEPTNAAAKAYAGWIVFLGGLTDEAIPRLEAAVATDPAYPDAHFFLGMALLRGRNDQRRGTAELQEYLRLAPPGPDRDRVGALLQEIANAPAATSGAP